eukprot:scaffold60755_cov24-Phaeocystis_antarctica.AAC.1
MPRLGRGSKLITGTLCRSARSSDVEAWPSSPSRLTPTCAPVPRAQVLWRTCRGALTVGKPAARLCWCSIAAAFSRVSSGPRTATANRGVQAAHRTPLIHRFSAPVASVRQPC